MSWQINKTLQGLIGEAMLMGCSLKGLEEVRAKKEFVIRAIQESYLRGSYVPPSLGLYLQFKGPMLCALYKQLKPEQKETLWTSQNILVEWKVDGLRCSLVFSNGDLDFFSRYLNPDTYLPDSLKSRIYMPCELAGLPPSFIVDGELVAESRVDAVLREYGIEVQNGLQRIMGLLALPIQDCIAIQREDPGLIKFIALDYVYFGGEWVLGNPLYKRRKFLLENILPRLYRTGLRTYPVPGEHTRKKDFYDKVVSKGGEGVIAKDLRSYYIAGGSRSHKMWIKIKRHDISWVDPEIILENTTFFED